MDDILKPAAIDAGNRKLYGKKAVVGDWIKSRAVVDGQMSSSLKRVDTFG